MSREKLLNIAERFTAAWAPSPDDAGVATLSALVSPDVVVHVPFPGLSPDFKGLLAQRERAVTATSDMKVEVKAVSVDETNCLVTHFFEAIGTHTGYENPLDKMD